MKRRIKAPRVEQKNASSKVLARYERDEASGFKHLRERRKRYEAEDGWLKTDVSIPPRRRPRWKAFSIRSKQATKSRTDGGNRVDGPRL